MLKKILFFGVLAVLIIFASVKKIDDGTLGSLNIFEKESVRVLNFGDMMFDRGVRNIIENRKRDPFEYIKRDRAIIEDYDIIIANLEGPIVEMDRAQCQQKAYNFQFASNTTVFLESIGINMVTIANNHNYDCYKVGFDSTKRYLADAGIDYMGDREVSKSYVVKELHGQKIAFVGIDHSIAPIPVSNFYPLIRELSSTTDHVIVNIHWGAEYERTENATQKAIAHALIDNGADVVFGHHPHVIQPLEIYRNRAIFYSLGNFVFDQNFGDTTVGLGVGALFEGDKMKFELLPFNIRVFAPEFMRGNEKEEFCNDFLATVVHDKCSFTVRD